MLKFKPLLPMLLFGFSVSAAVINLTGTVTSSSGKPISGAIVTIAGQKMLDTTSAQGAYSFVSGQVAVVSSVADRTIDKIAYENGLVSFNLATSSPVRIELFDMRGTLLQRVVDKNLTSGEYRFNVMTQTLATSMLAVRVSIGEQRTTFRHVPLQSSRQVFTSAPSANISPIEGGLSKVQATIDTLIVSAKNYTTKKVLLSSYETKVDVTLDTMAFEKFSFFVTSQKALTLLSKSDNGFGGDFRFGMTGAGAGLKGADSICSCIAEMSMPGSSAKQWRALLSVKADANGKQVNAIERIGTGPWYDRIGRLLAPTIADLANKTRPTNGSSVIANDLPNEDGVPNHRPDPNGPLVDNHHVVTGSGTDGNLYTQGSTCDDWTNVNASGSPQCGFAWPRSMGGGGTSGSHWLSGFGASGCKAGTWTSDAMGGNTGIIGSNGGYGSFYCFALVP